MAWKYLKAYFFKNDLKQCQDICKASLIRRTQSVQMQIFRFQTKKVIESLDQGSYEIRKWTINLFTSPMIIDKITLTVWTLLVCVPVYFIVKCLRYLYQINYKYIRRDGYPLIMKSLALKIMPVHYLLFWKLYFFAQWLFEISKIK